MGVRLTHPCLRFSACSVSPSFCFCFDACPSFACHGVLLSSRIGRRCANRSFAILLPGSMKDLCCTISWASASCGKRTSTGVLPLLGARGVPFIFLLTFELQDSSQIGCTTLAKTHFSAMVPTKLPAKDSQALKLWMTQSSREKDNPVREALAPWPQAGRHEQCQHFGQQATLAQAGPKKMCEIWSLPAVAG